MAEPDGPRWGPASRRAPRQLVVLCHGVGADGHDLIDLAPTWGPALPDAAFVAPHAPFPYDMAPEMPDFGGRQWFSLADRTPSVLEAGVRVAAPALDAFIDRELARLDLPAAGYALMGFSQGAMTVLFVGLRRPVAPRAILGFSGALLAPGALAAERRNTRRCCSCMARRTCRAVLSLSRSRANAACGGSAGEVAFLAWTRPRHRRGLGSRPAPISCNALLPERPRVSR